MGRTLKKTLFLALAVAAGSLQALEFESGSDSKPAASSKGRVESSVPAHIDAGDVPTAYGLLKYELRADQRISCQSEVHGDIEIRTGYW